MCTVLPYSSAWKFEAFGIVGCCGCLKRMTAGNCARTFALPRKRIAKGLANHPIGVVLLARLAVDRSQQGKGLGKALLFDALSRVEEAADIVGVRAVLVHAIDDAARRFYLHFEFEECPVDPYQLLLLLKDLRRAIHR